VNGRSVFGLVGLVPGLPPNANLARDAAPPTDAAGFTANGQRPNSNNITVDGITNIDTGNKGGNMATTNLDAVAELKVLTSSYQAEFGGAVGGQVLVVTKSGTRDFTGSAYWYGRRSNWDANTWINNRAGIAKPETSRNDFGGRPRVRPGHVQRGQGEALLL
jgi:TonB-dependent Receptor Plug Domain